MASVAVNQDPLKTYGNGVVAKSGGREWPLPLASTAIAVTIHGGIAAVRTTRVFRNAEGKAIEATITFPVPGDAILTGLRATIDGRDLVAKAQASKAARQTYEDAVDAGKSAILHEEKMRGIHMLSLGNLAPGKEASVAVTFLVPLSFVGPVPSLRIPTTVGEVYGRSPLLACDDIETGAVFLEAQLSVESDTGVPQVAGLGAASGTVRLDRSIEILVPGWTPSTVTGRSADGRALTVDVAPVGGGELPLDVTLLLDRSGSTGGFIEGDRKGRKVWHAIKEGSIAALQDNLRDADRLRVIQFDSSFEEIGSARGRDGASLVSRFGDPRGGTEIGVPVIAAAKGNKGDVLIVTDGRSHALDVQAIAALGTRISVVLVGGDALDAKIGHVAALTGGMTFVAVGSDVEGAMRAALLSLRVASGCAKAQDTDGGGRKAEAHRGGARISMAWSAPSEGGTADDVGRLAAGLILPTLDEAAATDLAVSHGLCTHLTSLVVVDEAGEAQEGIPLTRKVPLMESASALMGGGGAMRMMAAMPMGMMKSSSGGGARLSASASVGASRSAMRSLSVDTSNTDDFATFEASGSSATSPAWADTGLGEARKGSSKGSIKSPEVAST